MAKRRRVKPYARPTSFDSNVMYDIRQYQQNKYGPQVSSTEGYPVSGGDEIFHVVEGEILMRKKNSPFYSNGNLHCFSHCNGLKKTELKEVEYVGVAVTGFAPEREVYEQGFVANFGGLNTLYNNSDETIKPGDLIVAMAPNEKSEYQEGIPRSKVQFVPMEIKKAMELILKSGGSRADKDKALANLYSNRIMGTALSYARSKTTFDIILHKAVFVEGLSKTKDDVLKEIAEKASKAGSDDEGLLRELSNSEAKKTRSGKPTKKKQVK